MSVPAAGRVDRRARDVARLVDDLRAVPERRVAVFRVVDFGGGRPSWRPAWRRPAWRCWLGGRGPVDAALVAAGLVVAAFRVDDLAAVALRVDFDVDGVAVVGLDPAAAARVVDAAGFVVARFVVAARRGRRALRGRALRPGRGSRRSRTGRGRTGRGGRRRRRLRRCPLRRRPPRRGLPRRRGLSRDPALGRGGCTCRARRQRPRRSLDRGYRLRGLRGGRPDAGGGTTDRSRGAPCRAPCGGSSPTADPHDQGRRRPPTPRQLAAGASRPACGPSSPRPWPAARAASSRVPVPCPAACRASSAPERPCRSPGPTPAGRRKPRSRRRRRRPPAGWSVSPLMRRSSTSPSVVLPLHVSRPMQGGTERYHSEINAERPRGPDANILLTTCRQAVSVERPASRACRSIRARSGSPWPTVGRSPRWAGSTRCRTCGRPATRPSSPVC